MAKKQKVDRQIRDGAKSLKELMRMHLENIAAEVIDQVMRDYRKATDSTSLKAIRDLKPTGMQQYKKDLIEALSALSLDGVDLLRKEIPKAKKVKFAEYDKLNPTLQKKVKARADLLVGKQIGDLLSVIQFAYLTNEDTTDSEDTINQDLQDSALDWLDGTAVQAGAEVTAATVINEARSAFYTDPEVQDELDGYEFINGDPVSDICKDLSNEFGPGGTLIAKDDPNLFRYTPPLHWNCKSYLRPVLKGESGNRETGSFEPTNKKAKDSISFKENYTSGHNLLDGCNHEGSE